MTWRPASLKFLFNFIQTRCLCKNKDKDANANDLDLVLHDANGTELMRDESDDREPLINFKPSSTDTYYIAVYAGSLAKGQSKAGVAMAVTYK